MGAFLAGLRYTTPRRGALVTLFLLFVACQEQKLVIPTLPSGTDIDGTSTTPTEPTEPTTEVDDAYWSGVELRIVEPESGAFLPLGAEADFIAELVDAEGAAVDFDSITWVSDVDDAWGLTGADVTDSSLASGTHALTAEALLPNGDRLQHTVGGVLVQSPYAGVYAGTMLVNVAYDTYAVGCSGATTLEVDADGELVSGSASCTLSLGGFELSPTFIVDLANEGGMLEGDTSMDLIVYEYPLPTEGSLSEDGDIFAVFSAEIELYGAVLIDGEIQATRVTRDLDGE